MNSSEKVRIAHLSGPAATIQNTPHVKQGPRKTGLPPLKDADGVSAENGHPPNHRPVIAAQRNGLFLNGKRERRA